VNSMRRIRLLELSHCTALYSFLLMFILSIMTHTFVSSNLNIQTQLHPLIGLSRFLLCIYYTTVEHTYCMVTTLIVNRLHFH
jgi:hypothetical protein